MPNQIGRRLAALEQPIYVSGAVEALTAFFMRARDIWPPEHIAEFDMQYRVSEIAPEMLARIEADSVLAAEWAEFCRLSWLHFYAETGSVYAEHSYFSST